MNQAKTICLYHAECVDGAASAAVVRHKFSDARLVPVQHGEEPPPDLAGKRIVIVDFSYPAPILRNIKESATEFLWFDHHKTALPILEKINAGVIDLNESGATLTWKQLFPDQEVPKVLQYVRDKDIWVWELPDSRDINAALRETDGILDPEHKTWTDMLGGISEKAWQEIKARGKRINNILTQRMEKAVERGFPVVIEGRRGFAVNWTNDSSELGEYIYRDLGYDIAVIFSFIGNDWKFSLRSDEVDVSEIATSYGGGGHPGAAGFRTASIDWLFEKRIKE